MDLAIVLVSDLAIVLVALALAPDGLFVLVAATRSSTGRHGITSSTWSTGIGTIVRIVRSIQAGGAAGTYVHRFGIRGTLAVGMVTGDVGTGGDL